ncbi:hypothetical protein C1H76_5633 [Elsinoe australis]|uniref:Uncharacterized protein n=1 Tax=Elsinoe australis TaxID=40998 RepID=A0A4U7B484_9PEZI|nr:hypothetical protein C1H76_5633 [Elsinoe australis]
MAWFSRELVVGQGRATAWKGHERAAATVSKKTAVLVEAAFRDEAGRMCGIVPFLVFDFLAFFAFRLRAPVSSFARRLRVSSMWTCFPSLCCSRYYCGRSEGGIYVFWAPIFRRVLRSEI